MSNQKFSANRKKLNALHSYKQLTLWSKFLFDRIGLYPVWALLMNYFLQKGSVGIKYGNRMIYRQYIKVFKNAFRSRIRSKIDRDVLFFFAMGAESTYNARNLMLAKFFESKGWNAEFLICDGVFSLCHKERIGKTRSNSGLLCFECNYGYRNVEKQTGMNFLKLGNL
ncbi:MAG: hypothetical protein ACKOW8_00975, partial [Flavobacteriales bacterium]